MKTKPKLHVSQANFCNQVRGLYGIRPGMGEVASAKDQISSGDALSLGAHSHGVSLWEVVICGIRVVAAYHDASGLFVEAIRPGKGIEKRKRSQLEVG